MPLKDFPEVDIVGVHLGQANSLAEASDPNEFIFDLVLAGKLNDSLVLDAMARMEASSLKGVRVQKFQDALTQTLARIVKAKGFIEGGPALVLALQSFFFRTMMPQSPAGDPSQESIYEGQDSLMILMRDAEQESTPGTKLIKTMRLGDTGLNYAAGRGGHMVARSPKEQYEFSRDMAYSGYSTALDLAARYNYLSESRKAGYFLQFLMEWGYFRERFDRMIQVLSILNEQKPPSSSFHELEGEFS